MKAHYTEYLKEMLKSYSTDKETAGRVQFIRCYSSFVASGNELGEIVKNSGIECEFLYHEFDGGMIQSPYEPFIDWIKDKYKDMPEEKIDEVLDRANVYSLHKSAIKSYIKSGMCKRQEKIIISECEYERERFLNSLVDIVNYVWKDKPVIMVLHGLNMAQKSTIDFLRNFIVKKAGNISILSGYSEVSNDAEYMQQTWSKFVYEIELANMLAECGMDDGSVNSDYIHLKSDDESVKGYIIHICNLTYMTAYEEAAYYVEKMYHKLLIEQSEMSDFYKKRTYMLYAYVALCNGDAKSAFLMCKNLNNMPDMDEDLEAGYLYNYLTALIKCNDGQREQSYTYINECKDIAKKLRDHDKEFEAEMLRCIATGGGWKDVFTWQKRIKVSQEFLDEMERRHQYNHLSYIYFIGFNYINQAYKNALEGDYDESLHFNKALKLAKIVGNRRSVFFAWHKLIILYTTVGKLNKIEKYYQKCLEICVQDNRKEEEAEIYHGQGYTYLVVGKHDYADEYFEKAAVLLLESQNASLLLETLYNMTMNAIAIEQYDDVVYYTGYILRMMKLLKKERLRICNISKLYGLLTIAYIKLGKIYDAKLYLDKIKLVLRHILKADGEPEYIHWEDDTFLYYMTEGMICMSEGNMEGAFEAFEKDIELLQIFDGNQNYILTQFIVEVSMLYDITGKPDKKDKIIGETLKYMKKEGYNFQVERLENLQKGIILKWSDNHKPVKRLSPETMKNIYEIAAKKGMQIELEEKNKALVFFENWVDLINRDNVTLGTVAENSMLTMQNIYSLDGILWIEDDGKDIPEIKYKSDKINITLKQVTDIVEYFNRRKKRIVVNRNEKAFEDNADIVGIFGINNISSFVGIPIISNDRVTNVLIVFREKRMNFVMNVSVLTESDSDILRTAFRQLLDARNREIFKMSLEKNSVTDILTGLYNRQGMKHYLEGRYKGRKKAETTFTVLYMDLDNFKYCNDNFGHDVGDAVLVAFSDMLKNIVGKRGVIIRYGGDEFVILIPDMKEDEGVNIAKNIFEILDKNKGFKGAIEGAFGKNVSIEKSNRVSCSIGIASGKCKNGADVINILSNADRSLYDVKRNTKHDYKVSK